MNYTLYLLHESEEIVITTNKEFSESSDLIKELAVVIISNGTLKECRKLAKDYESNLVYALIENIDTMATQEINITSTIPRNYKEFKDIEIKEYFYADHHLQIKIDEQTGVSVKNGILTPYLKSETVRGVSKVDIKYTLG